MMDLLTFLKFLMHLLQESTTPKLLGKSIGDGYVETFQAADHPGNPNEILIPLSWSEQRTQ